LLSLNTQSARSELFLAQSGQSKLILATFLFSIVVNLLHLAGPLYMMQVYDRVLGSRSEATLLVLTLLLAGLFLGMGIIEYIRSRVLARIGAQMQDRLDRRVFEAAMETLALRPGDKPALAAQRDLEALQRLWASPLLTALFDMPWTPFFVVAIAVFHPAMGLLAVAGGAFLVGLAVVTQRLTAPMQMQVSELTMQAERTSDMIKLEAEPVKALGMTGAAYDRWQSFRMMALRQGVDLGDFAGKFSYTSKTFRLFLQSAMLGLGAFFVIRGDLTGGAMIAASILMGRALQPIEIIVGQWPSITQGFDAWGRLTSLLAQVPPAPTPLELPRPKAMLAINHLSVNPPGADVPVLREVSFTLEPGQALGVIGQSGSGKSTLARALIGVWQPSAGSIRLDGATLDQYHPDHLGSYFGYLPQRIGLFDGTIAENIARLQPNPNPEDVVNAAKRAAAHDMILRLPDGYDTRVTVMGGRLSGGQVQRIGLARALYGNPVILVLDEPNSNLDNEGTVALNQAIRSTKESGGAVLIMAHRPAAIQECEMLLLLDNGMRRAFGPRDQVLSEMVKNHTAIVRTATPGGVA
jgi:ATP-binding cassette subfamily C protein